MKKLKFILPILIIGLFICMPYVYADSVCPIGQESDTYKDLMGVLNIMQIAGPLLVVGFTVYELIKNSAEGDAAGALKKTSGRLVKRLIFCVLLFAVPILVNVLLQVMGIIDENGCKFGTASTDGNKPKFEAKNYTNEEKNDRCKMYTNANMCMNYGGEYACVWENNSCVNVNYK